MRQSKAFTLIELLVVVAIIGILAAVGVVAYNGYTASAKKTVIKSNLQTIERYINAEMTKCSVGIEMEAYELKLARTKPCSYIFSSVIKRGTHKPVRESLNFSSNYLYSRFLNY